jgi:hypothetical protein
VLLSWTSTPPSSVNVKAASSDRITITSFDRDGNYSRTNSITRNEVDYRTFIPQRSGVYTFEALAYRSRIDTVAALYDRNGRRLAYNDDVSSNNSNSKFSYSLSAGTTYVFAVTNYKTHPKGGYRVVITAPAVGGTAKVGDIDFYSEATATLNGTNLHLTLYGLAGLPFYVTDHTVEVKILDRSGQPIHIGSYSRSFRTSRVPFDGNPRSDYQEWDINVSNLDLSRASRLSITASYG